MILTRCFGLLLNFLVLCIVLLSSTWLQGLFEGLKAYRTQDGNIVLFRPEENAMRMRSGAERMCMAAPTVEQFLEAVKETVLANERWVICNTFFYVMVHVLVDL